MEEYFSIKARSSKESIHISGAERIVKKDKINATTMEILNKVNRENPDFISIKIEKLKTEPLLIEKSLCIKEFKFKDYIEANRFAIDLLHKVTNIRKDKLENLINLLHTGASPDRNNMRGAMIVNQNGERIEIDKFRGVRTTTTDFKDRENILKKLIKLGYTERTLDALSIATKNLYNDNILAEYCISDDSDYITGYIATKNKYIRITPLKEKGNKKGGRIYFVKNNTDLKELYEYLQNFPILIKEICLKGD